MLYSGLSSLPRVFENYGVGIESYLYLGILYVVDRPTILFDQKYFSSVEVEVST